MAKPLSTPRFTFHRQTFDPGLISEQVTADNPLAHEVAKPLFDAGVDIAAITCRKSYRVENDFYTPYPARRHLLTLLLQGQLSVGMGDTIHALQPGDIAYCPPGTIFDRRGRKNGTSWWLYFDLNDIPAWQALKAAGPFVRPYESVDHMYLLLRRILDAHSTREQHLMAEARSESHMLVTLLKRFRHGHSAPDRKTRMVRALVERIRENPADDWSQQAMAESLSISVRTLLRLFKQEYGIPPREMVIQERLGRAMALLTQTDMPVSTIAYQCGYASIFSFMRLFRRHIGMTAGTYRERNRRGDAC